MSETSNRTPRWSADDGFTLIELLVVLAILGLLAAVAAPQVLKRLDDAKVTTAQVQIKSLESTLDMYRLDTGRYPTTQEGLVVLLQPQPGGKAPYIRAAASLNDPWGRPYIYRSPAETGEYELLTAGADGRGGGGG